MAHMHWMEIKESVEKGEERIDGDLEMHACIGKSATVFTAADVLEGYQEEIFRAIR